MQISQTGVGQLTAALFGSSPNQATTPAINSAGGSGSSAGAAPDASNTTYRQILANYDVTDITPQQFSQMIGQLRSAGVIQDADFQELSSIRFELDRAGYQPNDSLNLLDMFQSRLGNLQTTADDAAASGQSDQSSEQLQQSISLTQRQIGWLQKFASVHSNSSSDALNTFV